MIGFAAYTAAETHNAFQWVGQLPKIAASREGSRLRRTYGFLGTPVSASPKRHLDRFSRFRTAHSCDQQTDRCYIRPYNNKKRI